MCPDWYPALRSLNFAARYLRCSVFDLIDKPLEWVQAGEAAYIAESHLRDYLIGQMKK